jgi:predicted acylesterase/phospholipase RssA
MMITMWYFTSMTLQEKTPHQEKFQRCMVLAGGGFRFGLYLGMYAAARETGNAPDVVLASCGGAIAASMIGATADVAEQKALLEAPEMYRFWQQIKSARSAGILRAIGNAARRKFSRRPAPVVPDLFNDYLFEVPPLLPLPATHGNPEVSIAIVGGKLLFDQAQVGQARTGRKLFAETVFCDARGAALLQGMRSPFADARWGEHSVAEQLLLETGTPSGVAARISIADMFYFRCVEHGSGHYIGGVVDLFPIELARALANRVMIEFKQSFDQTYSIPAWRSVLGLDGNLRLRQVNGQPVDFRFDTSDISDALATQTTSKKLDWLHNRIGLANPASYELYRQYMRAQWEYGYERAMEAFRRRESYRESAMRQVDRHSRGCP